MNENNSDRGNNDQPRFARHAGRRCIVASCDSVKTCRIYILIIAAVLTALLGEWVDI